MPTRKTSSRRRTEEPHRESVRGLIRRVVLALALACVVPTGGEAQDPETFREAPPCPRGVVAVIFVDNYSVFNLSEIDEDRPFRWAYELANRVHFLTDQDFIRNELLFEEGDCFDPLLLQESARILRQYPHISFVDIFPSRPLDPAPGDSVHVTVQTSDEWTTQATLDVRVANGFEFRGASLKERNLFGQGVTLGFFYDKDDEGREAWGAEFETLQLLSSRWDARATYGRTRVGPFFTQGFLYPFVGEVGRVAAREIFDHREFFFHYATPDDSEVTRALMPVLERSMEITLAGRLGTPGNLTSFGVGISREKIDFPEFPGLLEVDVGGETLPGDPAVAAILASQVNRRTRTRVNFLLGQRNIHFVERRGLDALFAIQDVPVGTDLTLTVGRSVRMPDQDRTDDGEDLFARVETFGATAPSRWVLGMSGSVEGLRVFSGVEETREKAWKDVFAEANLFAYVQGLFWEGNTLFARLSGTGGWDSTVPFQLTLGGPTNVRGLRDHRLPGARRVVLSVEDRIALRWPFPDLFDFGLTLFGDVGRIWAGDVPFGEDSEVEGTVGLGLRVGFPAGTRGVIRLDAAVPVSRGAGLSDVVFRISLAEVLGLITRFEDRQLQRSRRVGVGADLFLLPELRRR